ncbi:allophanate hydrolase [Cyphellophora europaea CBS 101466]|uniref:Allophanate hydrolase n=1 Tax=Cyphellophora europaea (strain CBS 101466) TaxID=1220924 RepID=W2S1U8_CYPE1|nr:allophanate hydrolase [Cyphellophora europaea CBS 101466]ETN42696.1 allophanate hydrolase [Cyphellophora europaea CBS 101466]
MASSPLLSLPSARPYGFQFDPEHTALVIIDVQRDFVDPDGFGAIQCGNAEIFNSVRSIVPAIKDTLTASRRLGLHVIHTREGHRPDLSDLPASKRDRQVNAPSGHHTMGIGDQGPMGRLLVQGEYGHDIIDDLRPLPGESVIDKPGKGSFWETSLHRVLMARDITHLLFCGVTTECCVTTTAREANDRGFECCILTDCTAGFNATSVEVSLNMFCSYDGLFGYVASSNELVAHGSQLLRTPPDSPAAWKGDMDLEAISTHIRSRSLPLLDLVTRVFDRVEKADPHIWTYVRSRQEVLADANALEARYATSSSDQLPWLYGVPFAVKDNFDVAGMPTEAACPAYRYFPKETAPVIKLLQSAGALLIGKTNMDQLATGLNGCRSPSGNPVSIFGRGKYISGGSSSGSGVAVAAGLVTFSLGTDTAGSGRVPAALNGIVGVKPTKGTLSARGIVPACRSLDTASIFAKTVEDARRVWYAVDQYDAEDVYAKDPSSLPLAMSDYRANPTFTFAVPPESVVKACDPSYQKAFANALARLQNMGGLMLTLSKDGYKPFQMASDLLYSGTLVNERIACIGPEFLTTNLDTLHPATQALFRGVIERPTKAWEVYRDQELQATATAEAARLFSRFAGKVDVLVTPTVPCHPTSEEMESDPIQLNAKLGLFTHFGNVLDLCAISVPAGVVVASEGSQLPFGISLVCARGLDGKMFSIARRFEKGSK